ncbi:sigma-54 interaction domain-containing protein [Methylocaldum szegediense]|uniref:Sigma-54 dependent transcriptional regulator, acetoin dehydrogenase operon transcriptional activator AcoR n=1 Tax=Methylocaldum szegediense TaxID=73780 RepID=A0ABN8X6C6_9GAMM|nr:sigma-54-dependent Fis family transcriptional regulator [Methylocaldum szegediense]CAI8905207.1 sigma-54 dependent transcriptional regulator, acetoin dehydrogenase operon transcriptional activator AcoR [Methylocaldum szegediense]
MTQFSPFLNRWLSAVGPDKALSTLAELMGGAVFAINADGEILFWSRGAERLFGFSSEQVLGRPCGSVIRCHDHDGWSSVVQEGKIRGIPFEVEHAKGGTIRVKRSAQAFFDAQGRFAGAIEILWPEPEPNRKDIGTPPANEAEVFHGLITRDPALKQAFQIIRNVAQTDATVLIRGESGTGKELVAQALHEESHRRDHPFLAINCAALSAHLLESELFGHVRGAFTGAVKDHQGLFKRADGGTLFLDEVAELPLELQAKLLRVLQEKTFIPVGGDHPITVDVRIVAATHRSLREEVKAGRFREDLMYRLRVVPIFLPPLRARRQDISLLLQHFIDRHNVQGPRRIQSIEPEAMRVLLDYHWPGNVRELQNVVEYAFAVGRSDVLQVEDLPPEFREEPQSPSVPNIPAAESEADRIRRALASARGRIDRAAQMLGMSRATFWRKRKKYGL